MFNNTHHDQFLFHEGHQLQTTVHLYLWYVVLVCHQYDDCENSVGSVYVGGYSGLSEGGLLCLP